MGFPGGSVVKNLPAYNKGAAGDEGLIPGVGRAPGGGQSNPLQYSCLENPMDRGAWRATVHGVAKSQTWLSMYITIYKKHISEYSLRTTLYLSMSLWSSKGLYVCLIIFRTPWGRCYFPILQMWKPRHEAVKLFANVSIIGWQAEKSKSGLLNEKHMYFPLHQP